MTSELIAHSQESSPGRLDAPELDRQAQLLLEQGIAAAKAGNKALARPLLDQATELDPESELGWLWLAGVSDSPQEVADCLQRTLEINPGNKRARRGLEWALMQGATLSRLAQTLEAPGAQNGRPGEPELNDRVAAGAATASGVTSQAEPVQAALVGAEKKPGGRTHPEPMEPAPVEAEGAPAGAAQTVLVVDDSPTVCRLVEITLQRQGYKVICASDGFEALARISDALPDLMLVDVNMPRMDGYQLSKTIKGSRETEGIPIVMLSGKDGLVDRVRGKMAGAIDYMTKPFVPEELVAVVDQHAISRKS